MRRHFFNKNTGLALISLLFAFLLFTVATSNGYNGTKARIDNTVETYSHTLESVPIDIKYDSDDYFISGYNYDAEVYLTSTNRVKLDSEINSDTRQFKVVADLTSFKEGQAKVTLQVRNLPNDVSATVTPASMTVMIGKKATKSFPVQVEFSKENFATSYELKNYKIDATSVEVTSDEETIKQIDHVVATLPDGTTLDDNYKGKVTLQAVNAAGVVLPAAISPSQVTLTVDVNRLSKTVPIKVHYTGNLNADLSDVNYTLAFNTVDIYGSQEELDKVQEVVAEVNLSEITQSVTKTVSLSANADVAISPTVVEANLSVVKKK